MRLGVDLSDEVAAISKAGAASVGRIGTGGGDRRPTPEPRFPHTSDKARRRLGRQRSGPGSRNSTDAPDEGNGTAGPDRAADHIPAALRRARYSPLRKAST